MCDFSPGIGCREDSRADAWFVIADVAYMRMPYRPLRRADAGMSILRASTGMSSLSAGAGISPLSAGAGISPLRAGAGMSSPRASNWRPLEYIETPVWP